MDSRRSTEQDRTRTVDDARLLQRFADGDRAALAEFVRRWEGPMLRIAYRIVGQTPDAEEVRQIVLLRMIQQPEKVAAARNVAGWVRRCVVNEAITWLRKRERIRCEPLAARDAVCTTSVLTGDDISRALRDAINTLNPRMRGMLSLRFDEGLTIREIADVLETPHTTVQSQLQSAIRTLRIHLSAISH